MSYVDFAFFLNEYLSEYIISLFISILLYFFLFRKRVLSIFDPFALSLFASMMGFSVMLFLRKTDVISDFFFIQYLLTQICFWIGLFIFDKKKINISNIKSSLVLQVNSKIFYVYLSVSIIFIFSNLLKYYVSGIPIFQSSRLNSVAVGGGFGLILRILDVFDVICLCLTFYFLFSNKNKYKYFFFPCIILLLYFIFAALSGSKAFFFSIFQMLFLFLFCNRESLVKWIKNIKKYQFYLLLCAVVGALFVLVIQSSSDIKTSVEALLFRLVSSGDTYYMAYPYENIKKLTDANIFVVLFGDIFRTIRIFPPELAPPNIGFELSEIVNKTDVIGGPNARHNVFGYVNFGFLGSLIFSFVCGLILGFVRRIFFMIKSLPQDKIILLILIYIGIVKIETDPSATIAYFNNILLLFPLFIIINNAYGLVKTTTTINA